MAKTKSKVYEKTNTLDCCRKEPYVRYAVVEFENKTYGVLDKNQYHIIINNDYTKDISRDEHSIILEMGQISKHQAIKLCKKLNKEVKDTTFKEIK